jgi:hypothetical protein
LFVWMGLFIIMHQCQIHFPDLVLLDVLICIGRILVNTVDMSRSRRVSTNEHGVFTGITVTKREDIIMK